MNMTPAAGVPQFGERREGARYIDRPGAYAVVLKGGYLLVLDIRGEYYYLPGGGKKPGETFRNCVLRELFEETRLRGRIVGELGRANQYVVSRNKRWYFNIFGHFFLIATDDSIPRQTEEGHLPCFVPLKEAQKGLLGFHAWAVKEVLKNKNYMIR